MVRSLTGRRGVRTSAVSVLAAASFAVGASSVGSVGASAPAGDPVYLPLLVDLSGPSAVDPEGEAVLQAMVTVLNDDGGLGGHPIDAEVIDTKGDVATASEAVADLAGKDPVAVFVSSPSVEAAIGADLSALGVPIIGVGYNPTVWGGEVPGALSCETDPTWCALPNFFTVTTTFSAVIAEQLVGGQLAGATNVSSAFCSETDTCASANPLFEGVAESLGLTVSPSIPVSSNAANYTGECVAWMQAGVDFIQLSLAAAGAISIIESCLDQGYEGIFGASAGSVRGELLDAPAELAGGVTALPWWVDDAPVAEYRDLMEAQGADYEGNVNTASYSVLRLLQKAIDDHADAAAPLDGAAALAAMHSVQDEDLDGLIVPVSFSEDNLDRHRDCFWPYTKDADGNFENPLGGLTYQCFPPEDATTTGTTTATATSAP